MKPQATMLAKILHSRDFGHLGYPCGYPLIKNYNCNISTLGVILVGGVRASHFTLAYDGNVGRAWECAEKVPRRLGSSLQLLLTVALCGSLGAGSDPAGSLVVADVGHLITLSFNTNLERRVDTTLQLTPRHGTPRQARLRHADSQQIGFSSLASSLAQIEKIMT